MEEKNQNGTHPDQLTLQQMESITEEVVNNQPLISLPKKVDVLLQEYSNTESPGFIPGIKCLSENFSSMRKVRGDGNCFYRALLFGYLENLLNLYLSSNEESIQFAKSEHERIIKIIQNSLQELISLGYPEYAIESFHEVRIKTFFSNTLELIDANL